MKQLMKKTDKLLSLISGILMAALVLVVLYSVCSRYFLNASIAWAEELSRFLFIGVVCLGSITAYFRNEHLGLDILVKLLPQWTHKYIELIKNSLLLFITAFMTWGGWQLMRESMESVSPALRIKVGYVYLLLPFFAAVLCLTTLSRLIGQIRGFRNREEDTP